MALNYSYGELHSMQEDAIRRVREMQKQATAVAEIEEQQQRTEKVPDERHSAEENENSENNVQTQIDIPKKPTQNCQIHNKPKGLKSKLSFLSSESSGEDLLLIALIVLLLNEDSDMVLILALLYILAD